MTPTLLPLLVARIFTQKLVAAVHVAAGHYSSRGIKRLRWFARRWCDCFVCVSRTTAQGLFGDYANERAFAERVRVIPNSVDIDAVDGAMSRDWRTELGLEPKTMLAGYVGRLAHNKGADVLIRAAARLLSVKPDLHWVFVGDGEERASLQSMVDQAALSSRVHFAGSLSRDAVYGAMKGFDIAVVPSREEGFGLTALEAMACRVPLVASAVDALQEIVVDGETGVLFKTEDDADLAGMLFALVDDPEKMKRIGLQGGMRARELYCRAAFDRDISELVGSLFKKI
jgi:glycosyltransferase involved in cell wall biosynthesis